MKKEKILLRKYTLMLLLAITLLVDTIHAQHQFVVTNTTDVTSGNESIGGSLRWAMEQALLFPDETSIISFNIPPPVNSIVVQQSLPVIAGVTVYIDGTTQPGYNFNDPGNPIIVIDNARLDPATGLSFSYAPGSKVIGVYLKGFKIGILMASSNNFEITNNVINRTIDKGINLINSSFGTIKGNYINTDKTLAQLGTSTEGIFIQSSNDNIIGGVNCSEGNTIGFIQSEGIDNYNAPGQRNLFSGNRIFGCTYNEIFIRSTGNGGKPVPVISSTGCITTGTSQPNNIIELFGSSGPNGTKPVGANAKVYMGSTKADNAGNWSISLSNITFPYVTATATNQLNNTSELAIIKPITLVPLSIIKPSRICAGEKVTFELDTTMKCMNGVNLMWDFGDGSPLSSDASHTYGGGTYTVKLLAYHKNSCSPNIISTLVNATECGEFDCAPDPCNFSAIIGRNPAIGIAQPTFNAQSTLYFGPFIKEGRGEPPYTYFWYNISDNIKNLSQPSSGYYYYTGVPEPDEPYTISVRITDKNGCTARATYSK